VSRAVAVHSGGIHAGATVTSLVFVPDDDDDDDDYDYDEAGTIASGRRGDGRATAGCAWSRSPTPCASARASWSS
jgi:hypothetical protein